jgi:predicted ABC-type ATPase
LTTRSGTATDRPTIFVLAGVNGAGKSSVAGAMLAADGLVWFNPDTYARRFQAERKVSHEEANSIAWQYGRNALEAAIVSGANYAFETTLGGNTICALLEKATDTHDVIVIFCGLASPEHHMRRVAARVARGGHDIPEDKIRERWATSRANVIKLMPHLTHLQVFDNSAEVERDGDIPDPILALEMTKGSIILPHPHDAAALAATPDWAKPIVQAALELSRSK